MRYLLMHKSVAVAEIEMSEYTGAIEKIVKTYELKHFPIGTTSITRNDGEIPDRYLLDRWWTGRSIPASRSGIEITLVDLNLRTTTALALKAHGLSLSDHYWVKKVDSDLKWESVNFYQNSFSTDIGEILFGKAPQLNINLISPDNTSDGWLKKKWIIAGGKRLLMKAGSGDFQQEPLNEVVACAIMKRLGINHVPYHLLFEDEMPYSLCETFANTNTELVSTWYVINALKRENHHSPYDHLLKCCNTLNIPGALEGIDKMLALDYIIANTDRHYNNFGFIRNPDTLEWLGFAPIYDSGTSLWHNTQFIGASARRERTAKPFKNTHAEQIKLVESLHWLNPAQLEGIAPEATAIFAQSNFISHERCNKLVTELVRNVEQLLLAKNSAK